jgi:hypothetical protein
VSIGVTFEETQLESSGNHYCPSFDRTDGAEVDGAPQGVHPLVAEW